MMENNVKEWLGKNGELFLKDICIKKNQVVLDFGCGAGYYTIPAAKVVGKEGKVYALDKDREVLNQLTQTAESEGLKNIVSIGNQSGELKINLEKEPIDAILLYDILHYLDVMERNKIYNEFYRVLKTDALLSVYPKHNKLDDPLWNLSDMLLEDVIKEIEGAKFNFKGQFYKKLIHDDNYNMGYILNFTKGKKGDGYDRSK